MDYSKCKTVSVYADRLLHRIEQLHNVAILFFNIK